MESSLIILLTLISSAFFSGLEIAFITSNKLRIELESKQGKWFARILSYFNKRPARFLGTMLLGNTIALVVFGIYMEEKLRPFVSTYIHSPIGLLFTQTLVSTLFILIAAEFLPKNVFRINPNFILSFFVVPLWIVYWLMYPIVFLTIGISEFILKSVFKANVANHQLAFGRIDLDNFVREGAKNNKKEEVEHEIKIFKNALDFAAVKARACMVPRIEIVALEINESIDKLQERFVQTRLSKILIYNKNIDNIIGYVHSNELFKKPLSIRNVLLPVSVVPESMPASEILTLFIQQHKSMAVVVDEYGGTSGILTMEDIMEEIFGEIEDEHDKEEMIEKKISDIEFLFSGRLEIDYLNEKYKLNLPSFENFETLSGLIIHLFESIPKSGQEITAANYVFKIISVGNNRVEQAMVKVLE
ncbi:MAG: HlyC/CorC family transporter [Bacteroidia bacterium]|nr:HlyC/CorC family transporter [Bacteroidia bacterium]